MDNILRPRYQRRVDDILKYAAQFARARTHEASQKRLKQLRTAVETLAGDLQSAESRANSSDIILGVSTARKDISHEEDRPTGSTDIR